MKPIDPPKERIKLKQPDLVCNEKEQEISGETNTPEIMETDATGDNAKLQEKASAEVMKVEVANSPHTETPPQLGDRYDVLSLVGSGGMGTVWKVFDKQLNETFAIKVLNPDLVADETANKRFQKEAKLASELTHANIAAIFGPGTDTHGRPYIIMRYVDGESLADILKREGKLSKERALDIFKQVCEALSHSHMKGIVHRDIKPSNIIISKTESGGDLVQIVDFGIARYIYEEVTKTQALTKAVDIFGSPMYMSPEQFLGEEITAQSDIYSLGCVLYEMLTGTPPFTDENPVKLVLKQISEPVDLKPIPQHLQGLLFSCLNKQPSARSKTTDALLAKLQNYKSVSLNYAGTTSSTVLPVIICALITIFAGPIFAPSFAYGPGAGLPPIGPILAIFFWLALLGLNASTHSRGTVYRRLELGVLTSAVFSIFSYILYRYSSTPWTQLWSLFTALATVGCVSSNAILAQYEAFLDKALRTLEPLQPGRTSKALFYLTAHLVTCVVVFREISTIYDVLCTLGTSIELPVQIAGSLIHKSAREIFLVLFLYILVDLLFAKHSLVKSLGKSVKYLLMYFTAATAVALAALGLLWNTQAPLWTRQKAAMIIAPPWMPQALPQSSRRTLSRKISTEALTYADTLYGNEAKLVAAWQLNRWDDESDAVALTTQIIQNKNRSAQTLYDAYCLRSGLDTTHAISDIDNAIAQMQSLLSQNDSSSTSETWLQKLDLVPRKYAARNDAGMLAQTALKFGYIEGAEKALKFTSETGHPQDVIDRMKYDLARLKEQQAIKAKLQVLMSKSKPLKGHEISPPQKP